MPQRSHKTFEVGDSNSGAVFDSTRKFRYRLWRVWDEAQPRICFVMLNPSTADESYNDPTIARCVSFARRWQYGGLEVVNAFAYRATDSDVLARVRDPVGPQNDRFIERAVESCEMILLAWGNNGSLRGRHQGVLQLLGRQAPLFCLGVTKQGQPRHPLYVPGSFEPIRFTR